MNSVDFTKEDYEDGYAFFNVKAERIPKVKGLTVEDAIIFVNY